MNRNLRRFLAIGFLCLCSFVGFSQIDPVKRNLLQVGYNAALEGHQPLAAYAFFYHNNPSFLRTNMALRLAIAPTYVDSELGFRSALGPNTDFGLGVAGGGFADSYAEIRQGTYHPDESFFGHGGELSLRVYHLFNPDSLIPLYAVVDGSGRYIAYGDTSDTDDDFQLPEDRGVFSLRTGLRWGGKAPTLYPSLAMVLSIWYEGKYRTESGTYGFNDREVNPDAHLFWGEAGLVYTTENKKHNFDISFSLGTSIHPDRFSAYRLGALLPLISEFPLSLPGYYYQEISARNFLLWGGNYLYSLDIKQRWNLNFTAATALVDYIDGLEQPGNWHTGVGGGILYRTDSWKIMIGYAYGVDAIRSGHRGAHSIGVLMQLDWGQAREAIFSPTTPSLWRGLQQVLGLFGN